LGKTQTPTSSESAPATSDLIDGGWDVKGWAGKGTTMSHPFGRFLVTYEFNLHQLKTLLAARSEPVE
jgi:hypothetical protein